jgi:hypothetical protein
MACRGAIDEPQSRAAVSVVTGHRQPDPRVGRSGWESNPVRSLRRTEAAIQTQGAPENGLQRCTGILASSRKGCSRAKGPPGPFCASRKDWRVGPQLFIPRKAGLGNQMPTTSGHKGVEERIAEHLVWIIGIECG